MKFVCKLGVISSNFHFHVQFLIKIQYSFLLCKQSVQRRVAPASGFSVAEPPALPENTWDIEASIWNSSLSIDIQGTQASVLPMFPSTFNSKSREAHGKDHTANDNAAATKHLSLTGSPCNKSVESSWTNGLIDSSQRGRGQLELCLLLTDIKQHHASAAGSAIEKLQHCRGSAAFQGWCLEAVQ